MITSGRDNSLYSLWETYVQTCKELLSDLHPLFVQSGHDLTSIPGSILNNVHQSCLHIFIGVKIWGNRRATLAFGILALLYQTRSFMSNVREVV